MRLMPTLIKPLCGGNQEEEEMDTCVLLGRIPAVPDAFALRDSKNPTAGTLGFTGADSRVMGIAMVTVG